MAAVRERGASPPRALPLEVGPVAELADALSAFGVSGRPAPSSGDEVSACCAPAGE